jgi:Cof subfamily protein (haloacid dehalogenase superfamily)
MDLYRYYESDRSIKQYYNEVIGKFIRTKEFVMEYKILFLDIDGTILMPDHTYSESTKEAILQVKDRGVEVFIATGRPLHEVRELAEELNVNSLIGYNGAFAIYKDEILVNEPMDRNQVESLLEIARKHHHEMVVYNTEKNFFTSLNHPAIQRFNETFQLRNNELLSKDVLDQILGMTIINLNQSETASYQIDDNLRFSEVNVDNTRDAFDVLRLNVNKGEAVKKVLQRLNITKEQSIAFGDGMNDKEMLQESGEGFAMGNAHPDLLQYAKHITTSVTDSGIYNGLKKLGLVK